jgi:hypothetical protein
LLNDLTAFLHFYNYLLFEQDLSFYLKNFEFPSPKDDLWQVELKLACWFWKRFFKIIQRIFTLSILSPLEKGYYPSFEQFSIPFPKEDLCQVWLKLFHEVVENVKVYRQTDDGQQTITKSQLSFQLR